MGRIGSVFGVRCWMFDVSRAGLVHGSNAYQKEMEPSHEPDSREDPNTKIQDPEKLPKLQRAARAWRRRVPGSWRPDPGRLRRCAVGVWSLVFPWILAVGV